MDKLAKLLDEWVKNSVARWFVSDKGDGVNVLIDLSLFDNSHLDAIEDAIADESGIRAFVPEPGRQDKNQLIYVGKNATRTLEETQQVLGDVFSA